MIEAPYIVKTGAAGEGIPAVSPQILEQIGKYSLRPLQPQEVYVFSVILCDNDIDRDHERFDREGLIALSALFLGKTGIFDHNPKSQNQTARIFACQVLDDPGRQCADGIPYSYLKASAYTVRSKQNEDLILEIEGGIKKEVSIGCSVKGRRCSICGANPASEHCTHQKGKMYGEKLCYHLLEHPTDAYEWSFVAVPAQRRAGVTKGYDGPQRETEALCKSLSLGEEMFLSKDEALGLSRYIGALEGEARTGAQFLEERRRRVRALALLCGPEAPAGALLPLVAGMGPAELISLEKSLEKRLGLSPNIQLAPSEREAKTTPHGEFKI